jgi:hypothetical protein
MFKITTTLRVAALGALVLGFACTGFAATASAEDMATGASDQKPVADVKGNDSSLRSNGVKDVTDGNGGNNSSLRSNGVKDITDGNGGNNSSLRSNGVKDIAAGNGNNSSLRSNSLGVGSGGNPTGEGALLTGNCFADMPVYNKEGKFVGRGIVNTCN